MLNGRLLNLEKAKEKRRRKQFLTMLDSLAWQVGKDPKTLNSDGKCVLLFVLSNSLEIGQSDLRWGRRKRTH